MLSIGNSFTQDASTYLSDIAAADGVEINAYNLYSGGRNLVTHYSRLTDGKADYDLQKSGTKVKSNVASTDVLGYYDWDYVILQGTTHSNAYDKVLWDESFTTDSGNTYVSEDILTTFKDTVMSYVPNATRIFVAPWSPYNSRAATFDDGRFASSSPDARGAYTSAILDLAKEKASYYATDGMYLPTAVAIDYLIRYYGFDETQGTITEDGKYDNNKKTTSVYRDDTCHLTGNVGRVLAGLVWYEMLTGTPATENGYTRETLTAEQMTMIKQAAHYACENYATYDPAAIVPQA